MNFTTSKNKDYRNGTYVPRPWLDYNKPHFESIKQYFEEKMQVWDADNAGSDECDFLFEDGKAFRLYYSWYLNIYGEVDDETGEELPWVIGDSELEEISAEEAKTLDKKERDWI